VILSHRSRLGLVEFFAPSRPVSDRSEAGVAKTSFLQARGVPLTRPDSSKRFCGATSLADVPFWRKLCDRMTGRILPQGRHFLKPKGWKKQYLSLLFSCIYLMSIVGHKSMATGGQIHTLMPNFQPFRAGPKL
jgi:hypothetical protein